MLFEDGVTALEQSEEKEQSDVKSNDNATGSIGVLPIIALVLGDQEVSMSQARANGGIKNVVLAHGGVRRRLWVAALHHTLKKDGHAV